MPEDDALEVREFLGDVIREAPDTIVHRVKQVLLGSALHSCIVERRIGSGTQG